MIFHAHTDGDPSNDVVGWLQPGEIRMHILRPGYGHDFTGACPLRTVYCMRRDLAAALSFTLWNWCSSLCRQNSRPDAFVYKRYAATHRLCSRRINNSKRGYQRLFSRARDLHAGLGCSSSSCRPFSRGDLSVALAHIEHHVRGSRLPVAVLDLCPLGRARLARLLA